MRDVLGTIQADQDAIIRAGSRGALVVDGGPGTGKTVVALHRTAYLLYSDPRLGHRRGGVLFVGPHQPYLAYVADVLPSLGEEGVQTCTLRDLVPEGAAAADEPDPEVARLKASARHGDGDRAGGPALRGAADRGHGGRDARGPTSGSAPTTGPRRSSRSSPARRTTRRRDQVWEELLTILVDKHEADEDVSDDLVRRALAQNDELRRRLRPGLAADRADRPGRRPVVGAGVPAPVCSVARRPTRCRLLQRDDAAGLDDAPTCRCSTRPGSGSATRRRPAAGAGSEPPSPPSARRWPQVVDHLIATDDSEMHVMSMLRGDDLRERAGRRGRRAPGADPDLLAGPFAHVVVDEAQELTDAEWQMLLLRCPSRSFTIVGDRAQARHGFTESWQERLERVGLDRIDLASLTHQLPDAGGGDGRGRAGHPGRRSRTPTCRPRSAAAASRSCTAPSSELDPILDAGSPRTPRGSPA